MPNYTSNFNLIKPLADEFYDVEVQNDNMDTIDEALKAAGSTLLTDEDLDTVLTEGFYRANSTNTCTNKPHDDLLHFGMIVIKQGTIDGYCTQILSDANDRCVWLRYISASGNGSEWRKVLTENAALQNFTYLIQHPDYYSTPLEIGKYIDLHVPNSEKDFDLRISCGEDGYLYLVDANGTEHKLFHSGNYSEYVSPRNIQMLEGNVPSTWAEVWALGSGVYSWVQSEKLDWQPDDTPSGALRVILDLDVRANNSYQIRLRYTDGATNLVDYIAENDGAGGGRWAKVYNSKYPPTAENVGAVQCGGGINQDTNRVYIGWNGTELTLKATVDDTDLGSFLLTGSFDSAILPVSKGGTGVTSLSALATAMGALQIETGSYTGTGTVGGSSSSPAVTLTFSKEPKFVIIYNSASSDWSEIALIPYTTEANADLCLGTISWNYNWTSTKSVSWYASTSYSDAFRAYNISGVRYKYIAFC